jgi:hypothetical protein
MVEALAPTGPARRHTGRVCSRRPQALHVLCDQGGGHHPSGAQRLLMVWALLVPCQAWQGHAERALDFEPLPESEGLSRIHLSTCLLCRLRLAGTRRAASPGRWRPRATCICPLARRPLRPGARTLPPDAPQAGRGVLPAGGTARPVAVAGECSATPPHPQRPWWPVEVNRFVFSRFWVEAGHFSCGRPGAALVRTVRRLGRRPFNKCEPQWGGYKGPEARLCLGRAKTTTVGAPRQPKGAGARASVAAGQQASTPASFRMRTQQGRPGRQRASHAQHK